MQKVLDFLERYVQWVAVGLAAIFLAYALYQYMPVVTQPVALELGGQTLSPGEVDPLIRSTADELQTRAEGTATITPKVPAFADRFRQTVATKTKTLALPPTLLASQAITYPKGLDFDATGSGAVATNSKVSALPTLPAAILEPAATTGFAQVSVAPAGDAAAPANPAAPAAGVAAGANATDTTWVRVPYQVSAAILARAFRDVNLPQNWTSTSFLRVELLRQRQLPGGQWSAEEVVPVLPTIQMPPMPGAGPANAQNQQQYLGWANANQVPIVQPEFFTVIAGADPRYSPPVDPAAAAAAEPGVFDPETYPAAGEPGGDLSKLDAAQKAAVLAVRQRRAKEAQQTPPPGGNRGGGGPPGGPPPGFPFFQPAPGGGPNVPMVPGMGAPPGMNPGGMYPGGPGSPYPGTNQPAAGPTLIPVAPLPPAPFQPAAVPGGIIEGWAYDVTATADATYRYRIRYQVQNPIYGANNVASDPQLPLVFSIVGEDPAQWTSPITIAPLTHVYLAALPAPGGSRIAFTVFRWQAGKRHRTNVFVGPGDSIGKLEEAAAAEATAGAAAGEDVDFRTNWTLVEVRRDSSANGQYALLMNADGALKRLDFAADSATEQFRKLNEEVDAAATAAGTPPPTPR